MPCILGQRRFVARNAFTQRYFFFPFFLTLSPVARYLAKFLVYFFVFISAFEFCFCLMIPSLLLYSIEQQ